MATTAKASISLPAELMAAARSLAERELGGNLSALVAAVLEREVLRQRSIEAVAEWEAEHGPISEDELAAARLRWLG